MSPSFILVKITNKSMWWHRGQHQDEQFVVTHHTSRKPRGVVIHYGCKTSRAYGEDVVQPEQKLQLASGSYNKRKTLTEHVLSLRHTSEHCKPKKKGSDRKTERERENTALQHQ
ncbi:hypothetical protein AOLI_G00006520 [Acnodon oligacanthus]